MRLSHTPHWVCFPQSSRGALINTYHGLIHEINYVFVSVSSQMVPLSFRRSVCLCVCVVGVRDATDCWCLLWQPWGFVCVCVCVWLRWADGRWGDKITHTHTHTHGHDQTVSAGAVNEQMSLKLNVTLPVTWCWGHTNTHTHTHTHTQTNSIYMNTHI